MSLECAISNKSIACCQFKIMETILLANNLVLIGKLIVVYIMASFQVTITIVQICNEKFKMKIKNKQYEHIQTHAIYNKRRIEKQASIQCQQTE
jgi:hypothetical protein